MGKPEKELVDLVLYCFVETEKAYMVGDTKDKGKAVWIAKQFCERYEKIPDKKEKGIYPRYDFSMPEWVAIEKGFV